MTEDLFEQYYAEKLWETIPSIYRHEDGLAEEPGVLRAVVQVLAKQAAILRRSQDSLWDDQFIDLCNEWAVPYIGELLATRLLSAKNKRGRRIDVAKTIYYRRRKGTPRVLEELIFDISGWEGKMIEQFQKLVRARHGLDADPETLAGRYSGTLPGGWADLRNRHTGELTNEPFEEYFHIPDVRRHHGLNGRYSIPKLAFYLYRLQVYEAIGITPFPFGDGLRYTFDPSGRDIPLFSQSRRSEDWDKWHSATEPEMPAPIRCRLLGNAEYLITESAVQRLIALPASLSPAAAVALRKLVNLNFKNESSLTTIILSFPAAVSAEILNPVVLLPLFAFTLTDDCGKSILLPDAQTLLSNPLDETSIVVGFDMPANSVITAERISAANLEPWPTVLNRDLLIDAERGRCMFDTAPTVDEEIFIAYHYGFSGNTGAGTYERPWINDPIPDINKAGGGALTNVDLLDNKITEITDSRTYGPVVSLSAIVNFTLQAKNKERPYLRLEDDWVLDSGANLNSGITLDGLWIGLKGDLSKEIILKGDFECVTIRNCTFDPGRSKNIKNETLHGLPLTIEGRVETLCITSSILGPVRIRNNGYVEELFIEDSILQPEDASIKAIEINTGRTHIDRSTIFGDADIHRLDASEALFTGLVNVIDTQNGCFRFSAAQKISRLPRAYESFLFTKDTNSWFTSRRFGDPGYAQLSDVAPTELRRGAENGSEIGAFSALLNPIKLDGLQSKIDEYMPFGLIPIFINKT